MCRSSSLRSTLNTGYITGLGMCKVCTEAVHCVALSKRTWVKKRKNTTAVLGPLAKTSSSTMGVGFGETTRQPHLVKIICICVKIMYPNFEWMSYSWLGNCPGAFVTLWCRTALTALPKVLYVVYIFLRPQRRNSRDPWCDECFLLCFMESDQRMLNRW